MYRVFKASPVRRAPLGLPDLKVRRVPQAPQARRDRRAFKA